MINFTFSEIFTMGLKDLQQLNSNEIVILILSVDPKVYALLSISKIYMFHFTNAWAFVVQRNRRFRDCEYYWVGKKVLKN